MRLLLDEMYPARLAVELRARGHDVVAVKERPDLREQPDEAILRAAAAERRALLTENVGDFRGLVERFAAEGERHYGVVLVSARSLPRSRRGRGTLLRGIESFLEVHPRDDELIDSWDWLTPPSSA